MTLKKNDFIEIDFVGKTEDNQVFDSNIKTELDKIGSKQNAKPFVFALGQDMFLKGIDNFLIGKEIGSHEIILAPEQAFGKREPKLIQLMPENIFRKHQTRPIAGMMFNFDGRLAKVLSVNGGRVRVDFNNPLAGKTVIYNINIKRIVTNLNEKIKSLNEFFFRKDFEFEIKDKKIILKLPKQMVQFANLFKDKYKELFDLELETKEIEVQKQ
jgi:FKBP-type peptidyl-prolyl cis-trans isomerase 2